MSENDVKFIALFFFFAFLDEGKAVEAATDAIENCRRRLSKNPNLKTTIALIAATKKVWEKNSGNVIRGRSNYSSDSGWTVPKSVDMNPWKQFQKTAPEDEFLCLIWSHILKISDEDISSGLGISIGTIRFRVGRALRKLGSLTNLPNHRIPLEIIRS